MQSVATHSFWQEYVVHTALSRARPRPPSGRRRRWRRSHGHHCRIPSGQKRPARRVAGTRAAARTDTAHTSAHLTCVADTRLRTPRARLRTRPRVCRVGRRARRARSDRRTRREEAIDCGFAWVPGYLHLPIGRVTEADADALSADWSLPAILDSTRSSAIGRRFRHARPDISNQARVHPLKYLAGLLQAARQRTARCSR